MIPVYLLCNGEFLILQGDCLERLKEIPASSVNACVTSPPYWGLRDYGVDGQLGLEKTPDEYVSRLVEVFREVRRVLRDDGTLWLNLGDSYISSGGNTKGASSDGGTGRAWNGVNSKSGSGLKVKDLVGIPWRVAFALQADGWYLRQDIIWHKPNPMPESVTDRCTKAHEYIFLLSKGPKYYFDHEAIKEPCAYPSGPGNVRPIRRQDTSRIDMATRGQLHLIGLRDTRNKRSVWTVTTKPFKCAHFATFPQDLIEPCILAGCPEGGTVLDPFLGAGTTAVVAQKHGRKWVGCEINPEYIAIAEKRLEARQF